MEYIALINILLGGIDQIVAQAALARQNGQITDEQFAAVKQRAQISDDRLDAAVAAAKARIAASGN